MQDIHGRTKLEPTDRQEYADDTILYINTTRPGDLLSKRKRNGRVTTGRQLQIQWVKVEIRAKNPE